MIEEQKLATISSLTYKQQSNKLAYVCLGLERNKIVAHTFILFSTIFYYGLLKNVHIEQPISIYFAVLSFVFVKHALCLTLQNRNIR